MDKFFSKILLFGEYSIIKGSHGLAIPFEKFFANMQFDNKVDTESLNSFLDLAKYLEHSSILSKNIDVDSFIKDIKNGLKFNSNIPQGYGVGSSGALCASILAKYGRNILRNSPVDKDQLCFLQDIMALMESFYHGTSSGLDPLISFVNSPVFIKGRNELSLVSDIHSNLLKNFYLIDTGLPRKTSPLVHKFMKMCDDKTFYPKLDLLINNNNLAIDAFLKNNQDELEKYFYEISRFQYLYFEDMIPKNYRELWFKGLETKKFFLKLCGAGGGGFLMAYSIENEINEFQNIDFIKLN